MTNSVIASYAILQVNWEQPDRKDYLDNFVLIVAEAIRQLPNDVITVSDVQRQLEVRFGFKIPQNTINSLLNRVRRYGYVSLDHGVYTREIATLNKLNFQTIQQQVLFSHESLIHGLMEFAQLNCSLDWVFEEAENALQTYLEEHQVRLLTELVEERNGGNHFKLPVPTQRVQYVIAKYIVYLRESRSPRLDYLETVIKGNLLANAIFADPSTYAKKFKNTVVYFDAPLAIYALGYAGEPRKAPVAELIKLLHASNAQIKIFRHSLDEMIGILSACADRIRHKQFRNSYGPSIEYFIEKGYSEVDVMMFVENLEKNLSDIGIKVIEKPLYSDYKLVIDEQEYSEYLSSTIDYPQDRPLPLERDRDSITSIIRFRKGEVFISIEESIALFITSNKSLAYSTRKYPEFNYKFGTAPLALTDYELTNLVWLKDPSVASNYPRRRLIADSLASVQPTESLWHKYLASIDHLEKNQKITNEQYFVLRHSIQAKSELMDYIQGDERAFTEGTVQEIVEIIQQKIRAEDVARANAEFQAKIEAIEKFEQEREARLELERQMSIKEESRSLKYKQRSNSIARIVKIIFTVGLMTLFGYLSYIISPLGSLNLDPNNNLSIGLKTIALFIFWGLLILQTLNSIIGFMPKTFIDSYEQKLASHIESFLKIE